MLEAYERSPSAFDLAIFTVKSYDTAAAVAELQQALADTGAPPPALLSVQNGVGNEAMLAQLAAPVIAGSITTPVSITAPGIIRIDKPRYGLGLAPWRSEGDKATGRQGDDAAGDAVFSGVCGVMELAGFAVKPYPDAAGMKWTKLLMNITGNATCAILNEPPETVFADTRMVDLEIRAWRETLAVMRAAHIAPVDLERYPFGKLAPLIRYAPLALIRPVLRKQIGGARGGKLPSLHIDLYNNKGKSEVRWLNGAVAEKGKAVGVATPVNALLTKTLLRLVEHPGRTQRLEGRTRSAVGGGARLTSCCPLPDGQGSVMTSLLTNSPLASGQNPGPKTTISAQGDRRQRKRTLPARGASGVFAALAARSRRQDRRPAAAASPPVSPGSSGQ
jgi:2-dehydropantoate 2-reductase